MSFKNSLAALLFLFFTACSGVKNAAQTSIYDVLVVGGGTGGVAAGIQSARSGARTLICEETSWLGGMLSAAGVSATDGNHRLPSGLWEEFRQALYRHYGGPKALETGWVSNTQFEPKVADAILKAAAAKEPKLEVRYGLRFLRTLKEGRRATGAVFAGADGREISIRASVVVDATDLGDALASAGAAYELGTDPRSETGEVSAPERGSRAAIQDLTWAAILKDYGPGADKTLPALPSYNPSLFQCCCAERCPRAVKVHACSTMLSYARLPNNKMMINWPIEGNDAYVNVVEAGPEAREQAWKQAKEHTLNFVRYIQVELGYKNLGLADDEFPTADKLPLIAYHREGRRLKGVARFDLNALLQPYESANPLYRTGISVGDYPLDHHHDKGPEPIEETFPPIPSFNVPLGALVPASVDGLIVCDKSISVTHTVNGATRLQPCVLLTGQAAGALAALSAQGKQAPRAVDIRAVQQSLLGAKAFLMPYLDVAPDDPAWQAVQKCGATGLLRGKGIPHEWANQTWFYPDSNMLNTDLLQTLQDWQPGFYAHVRMAPERLSIETAADMLAAFIENEPAERLTEAGRKLRQSEDGLLPWMEQLWAGRKDLSAFDPERPIKKKEIAVALDALLALFERKVDWNGRWKN